MNYQQILAIPFYFNVISTAFIEIQKTSSGVSRKIYTIISKGPEGDIDKFYLLSPDSKTFTLISEDMEREIRRDPCVYYLSKFLETAKLFEATDGNPLGIYMRYKTNVKTNGESMKNGIYPSVNGKDIDYIFYQTLCLMKLTHK
mgnify:FL=1|tara:strand:- start:418 stop:849 length:432 start_codon:yes stop_codon:yes gene_type:complete